MKICVITYAYSPYNRGGADIYAEKISQKLAKKNHSIIIITINPKKQYLLEKKDNITIYRFHPLNISTFHAVGRKSLLKKVLWSIFDIYSFYSYKIIKNILKEEKPDIVHIHTPIDITLSVFDAVRNLDLPSVFTLHDYLLLCRRITLLNHSGEICRKPNPLCKIYRLLTNQIIDSKPDIVISPSKFVFDIYSENGFFKNSLIIIEPHGIELNNFNYFDKKSSKIFRNINKQITEDNFNILYVGGLTKHKGVHILISAVRQLQNRNIRLHIVGIGAYENKLKELAKDDKRIIFYGWLSQNNIQKLYRIVNITVMPSIWYETFGLSILESLSEGVPVIGSRIGAIPELIEDNYNGFLFKAGNINELKNILENVISNSEKLKEISINALESVKNYEMSKHIERLEKIYEEAIKLNKER